MKKAALPSGQLELFEESISHGGRIMEVFIFDGAGNRLATCFQTTYEELKLIPLLARPLLSFASRLPMRN